MASRKFATCKQNKCLNFKYIYYGKFYKSS